MKVKVSKKIAAVSLSAFVAVGLTGCGQAATNENFHAVVKGDGQGGRDNTIKAIHPPGKAFTYNAGGEIVRYLPATPRNYVVAHGQKPDRKTPFRARTKEGTEVSLSVTLDFALNPDKEALEKFWVQCNKHNCAFKDFNEVGRNADGAEKGASQGWLNFLDEDVANAMEEAAYRVTGRHGDSLWQSSEERSSWADQMSQEFNVIWAKGKGYPDQVLCGPGVTTDGQCTPVKFTLNDIKTVDERLQKAQEEANAAEQRREANQAARDAAVIRYGEADAGRILGDLDKIKACREMGDKCSVVVGERQP